MNHDDNPEPDTIYSIGNLSASDEKDKGKGYFNVNIGHLKQNSSFCIVVELLDHPYCMDHVRDIGHQLHQRIVCTNHVLEPINLPKCPGNGGPSIPPPIVTERILIGIITGLVMFVAAIGIFVFYFRCRNKHQKRDVTSNLPSTKNKYLNSVVSS